MERPFFSIIIPTYNCEDYIEDTLKSLSGQSFTNWEAIIVDDCSTDGTYERVQALTDGDTRYTLMQNSKNSGASSSRNKGIRLARGKYIGFLDGDDLYTNRLLEKAYIDLKDEKTDCLKYSIDETFFNKEGKIKDIIPHIFNDKVIQSRKDMALLSIKKPYISLICGFYSLKIIRDIDLLFDSTLLINEDFRFLDIFLQSSVQWKTIQYTGYIYRKTTNESLSSRRDIDVYQYNMLKIKTYLSWIDKYNIDDKDTLNLVKWYYIRFIYASLASRMNSYDEYLNIYRQIKCDSLVKHIDISTFQCNDKRQLIMYNLLRYDCKKSIFAFLIVVEWVKSNMQVLFAKIKG